MSANTARARLLIFDVGGVLVRHDDDLLERRLVGVCSDVAHARTHLGSTIRDSAIGTGLVSIRSLHSRLVDAFGLKVDHAEFLQIWNSHFSEEPGMEPVIRALAQNHRLVLFSNTNEAHWRYVTRNYPVLQHPHRAYLSHELGLLKPHPDAFQRVLTLEDRPAEECIFVDDKEANVATANALGMKGLVFVDGAALVRDLAWRGLSESS